MTEATNSTPSITSLPSGQENREKMIRRTYLVGIVFLFGTIMDSVFQYRDFGDWQILADASGMVLALLLILSSYFAFNRKNYTLASNLMPYVVLAAYSPGDLFLEGVTIYNLLSGILVLILAYYIFRPKNILHWLRIGALHIFLVLLFSNLNIFERFDITDSPSWQISLPIFTAVITLLILWQIIINLEIRSLQTRLLLILISLGFIPPLLATSVSIGIGYQRDTQQAERLLINVSSLKTDQIDTWVSQVYADLDGMQADQTFITDLETLFTYPTTGPLHQPLTDSVYNKLTTVRTDSERFQRISFVGTNGTILYSTDRTTEGVNISNDSGYLAGRITTYMSPISIAPGTAQTRATVYQPLYNQNGDLLGTVVGQLNSQQLITSIADPVQLGETGEAYLVSSNNVLLSPLRLHPELAVGDTTIRTNATLNALQTNGSDTLRYTTYSDQGVIGAYRWLPDIKAVLIVEQSTAEAFQALRLNLVLSAALAIITLGITSSIAVITSRNLSEPIKKLSEEATQVWKGDLKHIQPIERTDEIGVLSDTLSQMTDQMLQTTENLEKMVADRTQVLERRARYLETTSQISRAITAIYDVDTLLNTVAHLINENFGYYHVGIFLLDENKEFAVLKASNSEGGWRMLAREHKLEVGKQGIVGYVTSTGESRIQQQVVSEGSIHYENPDLPLTRSEMALPLMVGKEIFGALDVQSTEEMAFSDEDVFVLQGLADAVAVTIQNTRLVQQLQENLETERRMYGSITSQNWTSLLNQQQTHPAYRSDQSGTQLVTTPATPAGKETLRSGKTVIGEPTEEAPYYPIAVPVNIRGGVTVGVLETKKPVSSGIWSREEITILESVCEDLGLALENARLFEDTQRKAQRDRMSAELSTKIWASSDVENILQTTVKELGSALQVSRGTIRLSLPEEQGNPSKGREQA